MKKCSMVIMVFALVGLLVGGCADSPSTSETTTEKEANFRLLVSDDPIHDFSSLNVTITKIALNSANDSGGWIYPPISPTTVNLTLLVGDNATEIFRGYVPSGNYTKVVLYTSNVTGILKGEKVTVKLPSGKLQISKQFTVTVGDDSIVSFIFDITVIKAGKSNKYILKPQIAESGPNQKFIDVTPQGITEKHQEKFELKHQEKHGKPEKPPGKPEK